MALQGLTLAGPMSSEHAHKKAMKSMDETVDLALGVVQKV